MTINTRKIDQILANRIIEMEIEIEVLKELLLKSTDVTQEDIKTQRENFKKREHEKLTAESAILQEAIFSYSDRDEEDKKY